MRKNKFIAGLFLISTMTATSNSMAAEEWVIPEKRVSAAAGLSDPTRELISGMGPPNFEMIANLKLDTREDMQRFTAMVVAQNPETMEGHEKTFNVKVASSKIAGVTVHTVHPAKVDPEFEGQLFIHLHGGGYFIGSGAKAVLEAANIASTSGIKVMSVDYTLSTEKPFPTALNEVVAVYKEVLKTVPASAIGMGGTSAGGGLALATVHQLKKLNLPLPGALFAGTPWTDLLATGDTIITNEGLDNVLVSFEGILSAGAKLYAGGHDLSDPLISPLYGDFANFPPTYLVSGTRDMLLSDTVRVHRKLREAGVIADLNVFEGLPHGGYMLTPGSSEFEGTFGDLKVFLQTHLRNK